MSTHPIQTNFTAGELSDRLALRVDFAKYSNGCETLENYLPLPHGGVIRRPGTRFVAEVKNSAQKQRLIPFEFSTEQAYILEFGPNYIRFFMDGGRLEVNGFALELQSPYQGQHLFELKYAQSADVLYLVHPLYAPRKLSRTSHTAWTLEIIDFFDGPYLEQNDLSARTMAVAEFGVTTSKTITGAADNGSGLIRITATAHGYSDGEYVEIEEIGGTIEALGTWEIIEIDANTFDLVDSVFVNTYTSGGFAYLLTTMTAAGHAPFTSEHVGSLWRVNPAGTWGYVQVKAFISTTQVAVRVWETVGASSATTNWREGAWSGVRGYPGAITFFENRLAFAGSSFKPQTVWLSESDDYEAMAPGTDDDSALSYTLAATKVNVIKWLSSGIGLVIGTVGAEFIMYGGNDSPLSPTNIQVRKQSNHGSSFANPLEVNSNILYIQRSKKRIRELSWQGGAEGGSYVSGDITLLADHLSYPGFVEMDYQQEPDSIIWIVRADGVLISLTYYPQHEVSAFARHITKGAFESVAVIPHPHGDKDMTWVVVRRTINGQTKRYIEYLDPNLYLDCGISYQGQPTFGLSGAQHLEGESIILNCNCSAQFPLNTVLNGQIKLPTIASSVQAGLAYFPKLKTLRPEVELKTGTSQGLKKRWVEVGVRVHETLGLTINGDQFPGRSTDDPMNQAPSLVTGDLKVTNLGWDENAQLEITQSQALPSTIMGIYGTLDLEETE